MSTCILLGLEPCLPPESWGDLQPQNNHHSLVYSANIYLLLEVRHKYYRLDREAKTNPERTKSYFCTELPSKPRAWPLAWAGLLGPVTQHITFLFFFPASVANIFSPIFPFSTPVSSLFPSLKYNINFLKADMVFLLSNSKLSNGTFGTDGHVLLAPSKTCVASVTEELNWILFNFY